MNLSSDSDLVSSEAFVEGIRRGLELRVGAISHFRRERWRELRRIEYEDSSVDGSDSAASLEDSVDDADSSNCGQSTMFYAALDNATGAQVRTNDFFQITFCRTSSTVIESKVLLGLAQKLAFVCTPVHSERA
jgi:hypothetical protein